MLKRFFRSELKLLGRWTRCGQKQSNWKVDMANIDNCGTCAKSAQPKEYSLEDNTLEYFLVTAELSNSSSLIMKPAMRVNKN